MTRSDATENPRGFLALVLHAHLPYVRHPEYEDSLEENWLFEAMTEAYIPLFLVLEGLFDDGIEFRLTFSVTPTLATMLGDPFLQSRYLRRLERQMELAEKEVARTESDAMFQPVSRMYREFFSRVHDAFVRRYDQNLLTAFGRFQELGKVELIASGATHGYLPLLSVNEASVRTQIRVGVEHYRKTFARQPNGFWLPECGYVPGLDAFLAEEDIRFTILETHGITRADERPRYGVHAPLYCPCGVAAFGRDPDSSRQVWSSVEGYPGDFNYREFYRDIGYDLDKEYIKPYIHPDGIRIDTGFKYHRITGKGEQKQPYVPEWAERKAEAHAGHFLDERIKQVDRLCGMMDRKPLIVAPYDAELFGHWWFEGPRWLDYLIRKTALEQDTVRLITLTEYLDLYPVNQVATPCMSSWGDKGFSHVWLNQRNQWIYPHLHKASEHLQELVAARPETEGVDFRALNQAARELLLAQASDWAFMINSGAMEQYAGVRTRSHLLRFQRIRQQLMSGTIDESWLAQIEELDNIFPGLDLVRDFAASDRPRSKWGQIKLTKPATIEGRVAFAARERSAPVHVVMISPELVPFAKTGIMADAVASLSGALEESGVRVSVLVPGYPSALRQSRALRDAGIIVGGKAAEGWVFGGEIGERIPVYFVCAERYFGREGLYAGPDGDYVDNAERFAFFSRAALEVVCQIEPPHVLHAHDWQAALAITYLKTQPEKYPGVSAVRTVLTVHDPSHQGLFPADDWGLLGLDHALFTPEGLEFHGKINVLKAGILFADAITTLSPASARKIRTAEFGFGMEGIFERRAEALKGILDASEYRELYLRLIGHGT